MKKEKDAEGGFKPSINKFSRAIVKAGGFKQASALRSRSGSRCADLASVASDTKSQL